MADTALQDNQGNSHILVRRMGKGHMDSRHRMIAVILQAGRRLSRPVMERQKIRRLHMVVFRDPRDGRDCHGDHARVDHRHVRVLVCTSFPPDRHHMKMDQVLSGADTIHYSYHFPSSHGFVILQCMQRPSEGMGGCSENGIIACCPGRKSCNHFYLFTHGMSVESMDMLFENRLTVARTAHLLQLFSPHVTPHFSNPV